MTDYVSSEPLNPANSTHENVTLTTVNTEYVKAYDKLEKIYLYI